MTTFTTFLLVFAVAAAGRGAILLALAGRREAKGRVSEAASLCRRGGFLLAGGAVAALPVVWPILATPGADLRLVFAALALFGASGFVALLAGLSKKPRPSGAIAIGLFLLGIVFVALLV